MLYLNRKVLILIITDVNSRLAVLRLRVMANSDSNTDQYIHGY